MGGGTVAAMAQIQLENFRVSFVVFIRQAIHETVKHQKETVYWQQKQH